MRTFISRAAEHSLGVDDYKACDVIAYRHKGDVYVFQGRHGVFGFLDLIYLTGFGSQPLIHERNYPEQSIEAAVIEPRTVHGFESTEEFFKWVYGL